MDGSKGWQSRLLADGEVRREEKEIDATNERPRLDMDMFYACLARPILIH